MGIELSIENTSSMRKKWEELNPITRVLFRHYMPSRSPQEGKDKDIATAFDEKRIRRISEVGVGVFLGEEPAIIQRAAFELANVSIDTEEFELKAKEIVTYVEDGDMFTAQKSLGFMALLVSVDIDFPGKELDEVFLKSNPALIEA